MSRLMKFTLTRLLSIAVGCLLLSGGSAMGAEIGGTGAWQITNNSFFYQTPSTDTFRGFIRINDAAQDKNLTSDCNLFYSPSPDRWKRSDGITLSFPQWMSFGFDLNGKNPY